MIEDVSKAIIINVCTSMQHSQSGVETHRAGEWLGDPVNEGLRFGGITRLGSCHMKLCHFTRAVLYMAVKWGSDYDS